MWLQVVDSEFRNKADATAIDKYTLYPSRGLIYDRNGQLLVYNDPMYDLLVTYNQIDPGMDTSKFCRLLGIDRREFEAALRKDWRSGRYSKSVPFVFMSKISAARFAPFQESLYEFPGFYAQLRNARGYPHQNGAHVLGYIREVNRKEVEKEGSPYSSGDYIGASGLEAAYEETIRGKKGAKYVLKDNLGREVSSYKEGEQDSVAHSGTDIISALDLDLQAYGELLMDKKVGGIVAIEPASGEILAMISSPSYDPNKLTISNNERGREYIKLNTDSLKPFLNRAVMAQYPPGSLFKTVVALIGLQEGVWPLQRSVPCSGGYALNGRILTGCHRHPTCTSVTSAIQNSCNAYFVTMFREIIDMKGFYNPEQGLAVFNEYLDRLGFGRRLGIDFPSEQKGNYPSVGYYDKILYKGENWNSVWIRSLGIGQGELLMTNIQLANLAAIIANRGYYYIPHLIKAYRDSNKPIPEKYLTKHSVGIDTQHFEPVVEGMARAVTAGTARMAYIPGIPVCGKTGTAENPHGEDHSVFFCFAPKDDPKIAIAVYIENAGFGGTYAAPIASLLIEQYLKGEIHPSRKWIEQRMLNANLLDQP
jgi:penicillin-binding protein 2